jgi:hypothetical protein
MRITFLACPVNGLTSAEMMVGQNYGLAKMADGAEMPPQGRR